VYRLNVVSILMSGISFQSGRGYFLEINRTKYDKISSTYYYNSKFMQRAARICPNEHQPFVSVPSESEWKIHFHNERRPTRAISMQNGAHQRNGHHCKRDLCTIPPTARMLILDKLYHSRVGIWQHLCTRVKPFCLTSMNNNSAIMFWHSYSAWNNFM
jgi:hypothetical protein